MVDWKVNAHEFTTLQSTGWSRMGKCFFPASDCTASCLIFSICSLNIVETKWSLKQYLNLDFHWIGAKTTCLKILESALMFFCGFGIYRSVMSINKTWSLTQNLYACMNESMNTGISTFHCSKTGSSLSLKKIVSDTQIHSSHNWNPEAKHNLLSYFFWPFSCRFGWGHWPVHRPVSLGSRAEGLIWAWSSHHNPTAILPTNITIYLRTY